MRRDLERVHWLNDDLRSTVLDHCHIDFKVGGCGFEPAKHVKQLKQVHGKRIVDAQVCEDLSEEPLTEGDGLFSRESDVVMGIRTADCLPVVLASTQGNFACVIHAGWRGLCKGILSSGVKLATSFTQEGSVRAFLGPCIGTQAFEVGADVVNAVESDEFGLTKIQQGFALTKGRADRWHLDLTVAACFDLMNAGLKPEEISAMRTCTFSGDKQWHSYRRTASRVHSNWTIASLRTSYVLSEDQKCR